MDRVFAVSPDIYLDEYAPRLVSAYFNSFTGRRFERLAGGGDRPDRQNRFDESDVVAVTMLSVTVPPESAIWILEDGADQLGALLNEIPADVRLSEAAEPVIADSGPADRLWHALCDSERKGVGPVIAGKLCARKRPHLLPVYDAVVRGSGDRGGHLSAPCARRRDLDALSRQDARRRSR